MRTLRAPLAAAVTLTLLGGLVSLVVAQSEGAPDPPQGVTRTTLFEVVIPAAAVPQELGKVNLETLTVEPGVDASVGIDNEAVRGKALYIDTGELVIEPMVDALLWQQEATIGGEPSITAAGEPVRLLPGDLTFLPAIPLDELVEGALMRIADPGSEPAVALGFHTHEKGGRFPGFPAGIGFTYLPSSLPEMLDVVRLGEAVFRLDRVIAEPGAAVPVPESALVTFYRVEDGQVERLMRGAGGEMSTVWITGSGGLMEANPNLEYELTAVSDVPAQLLELTVVPTATE